MGGGIDPSLVGVRALGRSPWSPLPHMGAAASLFSLFFHSFIRSLIHSFTHSFIKCLYINSIALGPSPRITLGLTRTPGPSTLHTASHLCLPSLPARYYFSQFTNKAQRVIKDPKDPSTSSSSKARALSPSGSFPVWRHVAGDFHIQPHLAHLPCPLHIPANVIRSCVSHSLYTVSSLESSDILLIF